jgi:hypothetical protein
MFVILLLVVVAKIKYLKITVLLINKALNIQFLKNRGWGGNSVIKHLHVRSWEEKKGTGLYSHTTST